MLNRIDHVGLAVRDLDAAIAFYRDTFDVIADTVFGIARPAAMPPVLAFLTVAVLMAGSLWVLNRRVSPIEVVT